MRGAADVHVLDEPHFAVHALAVLDQIDQLIVVDALDDDGVDLELAERAVRRPRCPSLTRVELVEPRQRDEPVGSQRVEADRDAPQAGRFECRRPDRASRMPLLVSARSARPGFAANIATSDERLRRSSGSPPVSRMRSTPRLMKTSASALISSKWSRSSRAARRSPPPACSTGSAGCTGRSPTDAGSAGADSGGRALGHCTAD